MRAERGLPSFRRETLYVAFERAFRRTRRDDFRIVEFSVQDDHVHLLVEADDNDALARGMKSFSVRANRLFNAALGAARAGVGRPLPPPRPHDARQVRNALVYCLNNYKKHQRVTGGMPRSTPAPRRDGSKAGRPSAARRRPAPHRRRANGAPRSAWQKHGLIHPGEAPRTLD